MMELDYSPLLISLKTSLLAVIITACLGVAAARLAMRSGKRVQWLLDVFFTFPLVLPPTVIGFLLLILFGRHSFLGKILAALGTTVIFSWPATVIASVVVSFPLMYRAAKGAFEQVDPHYIWAARTLGLTETRIFFRILVPLAWPGLISGAILAFARALGEFGATLMIAGNIPKVTKTIPLAIYFANAAGKDEIAIRWTGIILIISLIVLGILNYFSAREKDRTRGRRS